MSALFTLTLLIVAAPEEPPSPDGLSSPVDGAEGGACYGNGTCDEGLACRQGRCRRAAAPGTRLGMCAEDVPCQAPLVCVDGLCRPPPAGTEGGPCYGNESCNEGLVCRLGSCILQAETWEERQQEAPPADKPAPDAPTGAGEPSSAEEGSPAPPGDESSGADRASLLWMGATSLGARGATVVAGGAGCGMVGMGATLACGGAQLFMLPGLTGGARNLAQTAGLAGLGMAAVGALAAAAAAGASGLGFSALIMALLDALDVGDRWAASLASLALIATAVGLLGLLGVALLGAGAAGVILDTELYNLAPDPAAPQSEWNAHWDVAARLAPVILTAITGALAGLGLTCCGVVGTVAGTGLDVALIMAAGDEGQPGPELSPGGRTRSAMRF